MLSRLLIICSLLLAFAFPASAVERPLPDPAQEARAYALFHEMRCAVCEGEALAESPADVATDMRRAIRQRVTAGDSDDAVREYMTLRYGNAILIQRPLISATAMLWYAPMALLVIVIFVIWIGVKIASPKDKK